MRTTLARLKTLLFGPEAGGLAGPIPLTAGSMLSQEWLAPHLVRLPSIASNPRRTPDA